MNVIIRRMQESDAEQVAHIEVKTFSEPWPQHEFTKAVVDPNYIWVVAVHQERIVGYAGAVCVADEADITNVAVDMSFRRFGIASQLLDSMTELMKRSDMKVVFLEVRESNAAAIALYKQKNFYQVGRRPDFYRKPRETALLMRKDIE